MYNDTCLVSGFSAFYGECQLFSTTTIRVVKAGVRSNLGSSLLSPSWPASSPFVTAVGATYFQNATARLRLLLVRMKGTLLHCFYLALCVIRGDGMTHTDNIWWCGTQKYHIHFVLELTSITFTLVALFVRWVTRNKLSPLKFWTSYFPSLSVQGVASPAASTSHLMPASKPLPWHTISRQLPGDPSFLQRAPFPLRGEAHRMYQRWEEGSRFVCVFCFPSPHSAPQPFMCCRPLCRAV